MSFLNGIAAFGTGLKTAGEDIAKEEEDRQARASLINAAPASADAATPPPASTPPPPTGKASLGGGKALDQATIDRAHQVYAGLTARGMDPMTAVAFAANAVQESGANPGVGAGDAGASHGLLQWRGDRLANYMAKFGHAPEHGNLNEQLDFILHEVGGSEAKAYQAIQAAAPDPSARAGAVSQFYERPADTANEIARRGAIARQLINHFSQMPSPSMNGTA